MHLHSCLPPCSVSLALATPTPTMVRQSRRELQDDMTDMLNFHFSTSPTSHESYMNNQSNGNRRRRNGNNRNGKYNDKYRSSARRKAASSMFHLHSSPDHTFILTRLSKKQGAYSSYNGPDEAVMWDRVRAVRYLIPQDTANNKADTTCPICLDSFTCVRITKCGHCFCLSCLLRYVHTITASSSSTGVKCPCCGLPVHMDDVRPVILESIQPPKVQRRMKMVKLHRLKTCPAPL